MPEFVSKTIDGVRTLVKIPGSMDFFHCENCKEFFSGNQILLEKNDPHCPHCGAIVAPAAVHVSRRGK